MVVVKHKKITVLSDIASSLTNRIYLKQKLINFLFGMKDAGVNYYKVNMKYLIIQLGLFRIIYSALQFGWKVLVKSHLIEKLTL